MSAFAPFAVYSLYSLIGGSVPVYTWATLPKEPASEYALLSDAWVSAGGHMTAKVSKLLKFTNTDPAQPWEPADGTNDADVLFDAHTYISSVGTGHTWTEYDSFVFPAAATVRGGLSGGVVSSGSVNGHALATVSAGTDIISYTSTATGAVPVTTAAADTAFAAGASIHFVSQFNAGGSIPVWRLTLKKLAGQA